MFASDGQRAWRNAITLIAKREGLLSGDTLTVRRTDDDLSIEVVRRPHGESTACTRPCCPPCDDGQRCVIAFIAR
jgi:hypothetical protein